MSDSRRQRATVVKVALWRAFNSRLAGVMTNQTSSVRLNFSAVCMTGELPPNPQLCEVELNPQTLVPYEFTELSRIAFHGLDRTTQSEKARYDAVHTTFVVRTFSSVHRRLNS